MDTERTIDMKTKHLRLMRPVCGLLVGLLAGAAGSQARGETLEVAFWNRAPKLVQHFRDNNYASVGVLKFHVEKDGKLTHTAGTLNYNAARRLETALIFALARERDKAQKEIMIIRDATKTASAIPKADHLSDRVGAYGRRVLFAPIYSPSWGEAKGILPDAFVTGVLSLDSLSKMTVQLHIFDRNSPKVLRPLFDQFDVDTRLDTLAEVGESFRSIGDLPDIRKPSALAKDPTVAPANTVVAPKDTTGAAKDTVAAPKGTTVAPKGTTVAPKGTTVAPKGTTVAPKDAGTIGKNPVAPNPANPTPGPATVGNPAIPAGGAGVATTAEGAVVGGVDVLKDAPVDLQIFYDDKPVQPVFSGKEYAMPAPQPGQRVSFGLVRKDNSTADKYGVVLMVNGISTLGMERNKPVTQCQRWVFAKNDPAGLVPAFFKGDRTALPFSVVPPSQELQTEYRDNLGVITYTIFRENNVLPKDPTVPLRQQVAEAEITNRVVKAADAAVQPQPPVQPGPAPVVAKKDPAPVVVKKDPAPVVAKKDPAPVVAKNDPAPQVKPVVPAAKDDEEEHPDDLPRSLALLHQRLEERAAAPVRVRNAIIPGQVQQVEALQTTSFNNPGMVMSVTIRYFRGN